MLFAGFQRLSNLRDNYGTWDRYRRLSKAETDVHVFGVPDRGFPDTGSPTVHKSDAEEVGDTWFLVYLDTEWSGVVIAEQVDSAGGSDRYDGFFSFRRDLAETTATYLAETYLDGSEATRSVGDDAKLTE